MTTTYTEVSALGLDPQDIRDLIEQLHCVHQPRYALRYRYYRNELHACAGDNNHPYRQGQEWGLPARLTGDEARGGKQRKEIVIENDIDWRIDTKVEYLVGKPIVIRSAASDPARRAQLSAVIRGVFAANGGMLALQQAALFACIYGFADWYVNYVDPPRDRQPLPPIQRHEPGHPGSRGRDGEFGAEPSIGEDPDFPAELGALRDLGRHIRLDLVHPSRAIPILDPEDWRITRAYAQYYTLPANPTSASAPASASRWWPFARRASAAASPASPASSERDAYLDIVTPNRWQRYRSGLLIAAGENQCGRIPIAHIPGDAEPFAYFGRGDIEPLIGLQDELNTRLSDRANRIALQAFKMYLGKGIENFGELAIAPGQMWHTENADASINEFGGDSGAPSEDRHIADIREALDKKSAVSPIAAGAIKNRLGNLTSAAALRITLIALLSQTTKRRSWIGQAMQRVAELALGWLDLSGKFKSNPEERRIEISWPSPLPENLAERLAEAEAKIRLGVPQPIVLAELGYEVPSPQATQTPANAGKGTSNAPSAQDITDSATAVRTDAAPSGTAANPGPAGLQYGQPIGSPA